MKSPYAYPTTTVTQILEGLSIQEFEVSLKYSWSNSVCFCVILFI